MELQDLRDFEYRCIQEEQPACQAACPLHVDVRKFMAQARAGDFSAYPCAYKSVTISLKNANQLCSC